MTLVRDVMTREPISIDPEAPLETAMAIMRERRIRHLPVVDAGQQLVGIVTDRDLRSVIFGGALADYLPPEEARRLRALSATLNDVKVGHLMTWRVVTTSPEAPLAQAAALMATSQVGSLPIVEHGRLVGIVTEHDVFKALASSLPSVRGSDPDTYFW